MATHVYLCLVLMVCVWPGAEACSCPEKHPQQQICGANTVMQVKVILEAKTEYRERCSNYYFVQIKKVFMDASGHAPLGKYFVLSAPQGGGFCIKTLQKNKSYLIAGYRTEEIMVINTCQFIEIASKKVKKDVAKYLKNCYCGIESCSRQNDCSTYYMCTYFSFRYTIDDEYDYSVPRARFYCLADNAVCGKKNGKCGWRYKNDLTDCDE